MAGPLFRELACEIAENTPNGATLFTGHSDTLAFEKAFKKLKIKPMPSYNRHSKYTRLTSWLSYTFCASIELFRMKKTSVAIIASNPPTIFLLLFIFRLLGRRYFLVVYDIYPHALISLGILGNKNPIAILWRRLNQMTYNKSEGVITIGNKMASKIEEQFDCKQTKLGKVEVVPVWVDTDTFKPLAKHENSFIKRLGLEDKFVVLYSGNMGLSHDIKIILDSADLLSNRKDIVFVLIGQGTQWKYAQKFQIDRKLDNLIVLPFQPESELPMSLAVADIAIVSLQLGAENLMVPSKTYYYMSVGAALIGVCQIESELTDLIKSAGCGFRVLPGEPDALVQSLVNTLDSPAVLDKYKKASRTYCCTYHDRKICTQNFLTILEKNTDG